MSQYILVIDCPECGKELVGGFYTNLSADNKVNLDSFSYTTFNCEDCKIYINTLGPEEMYDIVDMEKDEEDDEYENNE